LKKENEMKKIVIYLIFTFCLLSLSSQTPFNLEFSLPKIDPDDFTKRVWIDEIDQNGEEEIWVNYTSHVDDDYIWRLISYDLSGNLLTEYSEHYTYEPYTSDKKFKSCRLFNINGTIFNVIIFEEDIESVICKCILQIRNFETHEVIDSTYVFIQNLQNEFYYFQINFLKMFSNQGTNYLHIGMNQEYDHLNNNIDEDTILYKYVFNEGFITHVETINEGGAFLIEYEFGENLISIDYEYEEEPDSRYIDEEIYYIYLLSNDVPTSIELINAYLECDDLDIITTNDFNYTDYGLIIYHKPHNWEESDHYLVCYSPDFSEILWETTIISDYYNHQASCLSLSSGNNYVLYFVCDFIYPEYFHYFQILNRITGDIVVTHETEMVPDEICRKDNGDVLFFEYENEQINVYSFNEEILDSEEILTPIDEYQLTNHPNPFNPSTEINFQIPENIEVESAKISIYNLRGQKIKTLNCHPELIEGSVEWDGTDLSSNSVSSGIYFYNLIIDGKTQVSKKCILLK
jgi:Secretion system C-terminal sorting domain